MGNVLFTLILNTADIVKYFLNLWVFSCNPIVYCVTILVIYCMLYIVPIWLTPPYFSYYHIMSDDEFDPNAAAHPIPHKKGVSKGEESQRHIKHPEYETE